MPGKPPSKGQWQPAPEPLVQAFEKAVGSVPEAQMRKMFGYPACFINGNMFAGLFADKMFLRLSDRDRESFLRLKNAGLFEPMTGRPMREYVVVPPTLLNSQAKLAPWLDKALEYAKSLPPKASKSKRKK